jgi:hypothetical protein
LLNQCLQLESTIAALIGELAGFRLFWFAAIGNTGRCSVATAMAATWEIWLGRPDTETTPVADEISYRRGAARGEYNGHAAYSFR